MSHKTTPKQITFMQIFINFIIVTITCAFITSVKIHGQVGINLEMRMLDVSIPNNAFNHDNTYATTLYFL